MGNWKLFIVYYNYSFYLDHPYLLSSLLFAKFLVRSVGVERLNALITSFEDSGGVFFSPSGNDTVHAP